MDYKVQSKCEKLEMHIKTSEYLSDPYVKCDCSHRSNNN